MRNIMGKTAVVAVGYNRPEAIRELIDSVTQAEYSGDEVDLVFSIDRGERQNEIVKLAQETSWPNGEKIIRAYDERQGLRRHIIQCGDLTEKYDAVVVLEDDLRVSKYFYSYVKHALEFSRGNDRIAGISLYKHLFHQGAGRFFEPDNNGYDAFLMQVAQSWGQCWSKGMWKPFKEWYLSNEDKDLSQGDLIPQYVSNWDSHSWLKYFMRYLAETDKYFIYPYIGLSTNCSEAGQHNSNTSNDYQIPLLNGPKSFVFPQIEDAVRYDAFFERQGFEKLYGDLYPGGVILDFYGQRKDFREYRYACSTQRLPYKVAADVGLKFRPVERNFIDNCSGSGAFIYDLQSPESVPGDNRVLLTRYDARATAWRDLLRLTASEIKDAFKRKLGK